MGLGESQGPDPPLGRLRGPHLQEILPKGVLHRVVRLQGVRPRGLHPRGLHPRGVRLRAVRRQVVLRRGGLAEGLTTFSQVLEEAGQGQVIVILGRAVLDLSGRHLGIFDFLFTTVLTVLCLII